MATQPIDYDALAQQHGGAPAAIDYDTLAAQHGATNASDSALVHGAKEFWNQVNPMNAVRGLAQLTYHPVDTLKADAGERQQILDKGKAAYEKGNYTEAAAHLLYGMLPLLGPNLERSGEQFQQGDIAGGVGSSVGQGVALAAPELVPRGASAAADVAGRAVSAAKPALKAGVGAVKDMATAENIGTAVGGAAGGYAGHLIGEPVGAGVAGAGLGRAFGKAFGKRLAAGDVAEEAAAEAAPAAQATAPDASAPTPEPAQPPAATPSPEPAAATPAPAPKITPKVVGKQLDEALGAEPAQKPVPGVPLRNQPAAMRAAAGKLPEGFTPVDSTALKAYKYSPDTREFESITTGGQHYVHGDVSPEEVEAFEGAKSKGQAWQQIRQNPLVAKVVNGQRVAAKPVSRTVVLDPTTNQPEFSDVVSAKTGIPEEDLTDLLQQSLKQIQARKAAQTTR